jgi:acyl-CoA synthetase (AMP-forming)/AMP-acid ligase II
MLGDRLRAHPTGVRAVHDQRWWTYGELVTAAEPIARRIAELGLGRGDVVALPIDRGIEAVVATCATLLAGAIPAVLDPRDPDTAARTIARLRPALVMSRRPTRACRARTWSSCAAGVASCRRRPPCPPIRCGAILASRI